MSQYHAVFSEGNYYVWDKESKDPRGKTRGFWVCSPITNKPLAFKTFKATNDFIKHYGYDDAMKENRMHGTHTQNKEAQDD